ncbi:MAG TPA: DNA (cytosine-5-)-methyltransferase [bacterium]|jgi:DNA-cytosine methyltransferase|nr:DNA (cytosine-5-)-methyltransferase [bacterium]HQC49811.1 DNA (cytosine-5-)-methyltransferase [bacterium]
MQFRILDLFSGAGGLSLGLEMNDRFKTVVATDFFKNSLSTLKKNMPDVEIIFGDILDKNVKKSIIDKSKKGKVNMIVGGPPCQGFSNKGKKLGLSDPRNFLFLEYLNIVKELKPEIFIMENVKTLVTASDGYFINEINDKFKKLGYIVSFQVLKASDFGVPQSRERTFIIGSRSIAFNFNMLIKSNKTVTVKDAISDLHYLESGEGSVVMNYLNKPLSRYQKIMRNKSSKLFNHTATSHSKIAIRKLSLIPPEKGKEYLPKELLGNQKFKTTWSRLEWNKVSPTIDTRFDTPSNGKNSHPELNRAITPREAARIQSFPDNFEFLGSKTEICKQIGNAVPPLLAKAIADSIILQYINRKNVKQKRFEIFQDDAYNKIHEFYKDGITVDHIITDPPYNISQDNNFSTMKSANRKGVDFGEWDKDFDLTGWIKDYAKILNQNGSMIIFCSYRFISRIIEVLESNDLVVKDILEWRKSNPMPRNVGRRYVQDTEFAIWAVKKGARWVFNKPKNESYLRAQFVAPVVSGKERTIHSTQKSLFVMEKIIQIHTNKGETILDPFMGSGTTGEAALKNGRNFIGIELDDKYFDISSKRLSAFKQ